MSKGPKYGEFSFDKEAGFSGSAGMSFVRPYARGGRATPFWERPDPTPGSGKSLAPKQKAAAKARAKAAGRPYPNLIDNAAVSRQKGK